MPSTLWNLVFIQIKWTFGSNDLLFPDTPNRPSVPSSFFIFFFLALSSWWGVYGLSISSCRWQMLGLKGKENFRAPKNKKKKGRRKCVWNLFQWLAAAFNYYSFSRKGQWRPTSHRSSCRVGLSFCFLLYNKKNYCIHPAQIVRMCRTWQTERQFTFVLCSKLLLKLSFFWHLKRGTLFFTLLDEY